jgi:exodeoxyribonuclease VII large subunit
VLRRGFSVTLKMPQGKIISSVKSLTPGDIVKTKLAEGFFISKVTEIKATGEA